MLHGLNPQADSTAGYTPKVFPNYKSGSHDQLRHFSRNFRWLFPHPYIIFAPALIWPLTIHQATASAPGDLL